MAEWFHSAHLLADLSDCYESKVFTTRNLVCSEAHICFCFVFFQKHTCTGENAIVIVSGANLDLRPCDVQQAESLIAVATVVVCQLEVSPEISLAALQMAKKHGGMYGHARY